MYACLGGTCTFVRMTSLLHATAVTQGVEWKLTLRKKIPAPLLLGFELATFWPWVQHSTNKLYWHINTPANINTDVWLSIHLLTQTDMRTSVVWRPVSTDMRMSQHCRHRHKNVNNNISRMYMCQHSNTQGQQYICEQKQTWGCLYKQRNGDINKTRPKACSTLTLRARMMSLWENSWGRKMMSRKKSLGSLLAGIDGSLVSGVSSSSSLHSPVGAPLEEKTQTGVWTINKHKEVIALDRQGTQKQRPELPKVTPPGMGVNNFTKGTSSKKDAPGGIYTLHCRHTQWQFAL